MSTSAHTHLDTFVKTICKYIVWNTLQHKFKIIQSTNIFVSNNRVNSLLSISLASLPCGQLQNPARWFGDCKLHGGAVLWGALPPNQACSRSSLESGFVPESESLIWRSLRLRALSVSTGLLCNFVAVYLTFVQFILQTKPLLYTTVHLLLQNFSQVILKYTIIMSRNNSWSRNQSLILGTQWARSRSLES